jgi:hypothetical protein
LTNRELDVDGKSVDEAAQGIERHMIEDTLGQSGGNKQKRLRR